MECSVASEATVAERRETENLEEQRIQLSFRPMAPLERSRKRLSSESASATAKPSMRRRLSAEAPLDSDIFLAVLADADCTLFGNDAPLLGSVDVRHLQLQLERRLGSDSGLRDKFVAGLQTHIADEANLRRILKPISSANRGGSRTSATESLARVLLTVASIQIQVASIFLEKLPEYFGDSDSMTPSMESVPRLILGQFRWLDYLVDSKSVTQKLLEVLPISPLNLKKEMISFLPELVSDDDHETVMSSLEQMLKDDLQIIVPVLDALSNLNLDKHLHEQVVEIALSSLRSADAEDLPLLVRFLLQSTTSENARRIINQLRENLHFVTVTDMQPDHKLKGKVNAVNYEALVLDALRSGLRFQNLICEVFLKEIKSIEGERNHKVLDIWLLLILHANGGMHRKAVESLLKRKVTNRDISAATLRQCIKGHGVSLQDYFQTFLSVSESLLRSKDVCCMQFGKQIYVFLFEEFVDTYHRQEVLGSLITHTGTGIADEVNTALSTLVLLAENYPHDMLPVSSFINGILDYLESFPSDSLHQVYRIFSYLAMACWSFRGASSHSSVADELLIFVRKQVTNPDLRYKHMGIIGAVNLISCLGVENVSNVDPQKETATEAVALLQMTLEMCKTSWIARGFFYDELAMHIETQAIHISIIEWVSKHTNEFETVFLGDLESGSISVASELQGDLWMNLDGDASPVFLNVLPMLTSDNRSVSSSLLFLSSNFRLLAAVERATNQGLLGSIDALLGCPIYLPKAQILSGRSWAKLSTRQKEISCIAIFHAINWIRELVNAFSTQIEASTSGLTQASLDETIGKLINRLRHLLLLEHILNECLKAVPHPIFPQLHCFGDSQDSYRVEIASMDLDIDNKCPKPRKRNRKGEVGSQQGAGKPSQSSQANGKLRQGTILDAFDKANKGGNSSQEPLAQSQRGSNANQATENTQKDAEEDISNVITKQSILNESLGLQKWKLRPFRVSSLDLLSVPQALEAACCSDPSAQLPLHLYLLRDLLFKMESCMSKSPSRVPRAAGSTQPKPPSGLSNLGAIDVLLKLQKLFPSIRLHLDTAVSILEEEGERGESNSCACHWTSICHAAGNPQGLDFNPSRTGTAESVLYVVLRCLGKILQFPELKTRENLSLVKELLIAFGSKESMDKAFPDLLVQPSIGSLDYMSCLAYAYLDGLFNAAVKASILVATELVMVLKDLVEFLKAFNDESAETRGPRSVTAGETVSYLSRRLSTSATRLLEHDWACEEPGKTWKGKHDVLQRLLRMMIQRSHSPIEMLQDLSSNVMTQVPAKGWKCSIPGHPALNPTTFVIWYRVQHEIVLEIFGRVVKEILALSRLKSTTNNDRAGELLDSAHQCVIVHVSLVNLTRIHEKTALLAVALRYGGKFVDTFLKGLEFLEAHYEPHKTVINTMLKELQKATRTIQAICSDAKGQKKMPVTCKVPAVKRSMERYVFCIKALLHKASNGTAFWMGNLKHKDLQGREVGSQLPVSDEEEDHEAEIHDQDDDNVNVEGDPSQEDDVSLEDA